MLKRFEARLWTLGVAVPLILAGCSTTPPTSSPTGKAIKANYAVQGGQAETYAEPEPAPPPAVAPPVGVPVPCPECPPQVAVGVSPFNLVTFDWISSHPILDYTWYFLRGNFLTFGWGSQFLANFSDFMYFPTSYGFWPYALDAGLGAYTPFVTPFGFPFIGFNGDPYLWDPYFGAGIPNVALGDGIGLGLLPPGYAGVGAAVPGGPIGPGPGGPGPGPGMGGYGYGDHDNGAGGYGMNGNGHNGAGGYGRNGNGHNGAGGYGMNGGNGRSGGMGQQRGGNGGY